MKFKIAFLNFWGALCPLLLGWSAANAETNALPVTPALINQLAEEARTNAPALQAAGARVRAAEFGIQAVRTWEDPQARFGGLVSSGRGPRLDEEGNLAYGLEQTLPLWGKARAARDVARAEFEREDAQAVYQFQMLRLELARQLFAVARAEHAVKIGREDSAWLDIMTRVAEERHRARTGSQIEALRMQNERAKQAEQLRADEQQLEQERVQLNRLLARPLTHEWPVLILPEIAAPIEFTERLRKLTLGNEARLKVLRREVKEAEAARALAEKQRLPEVSLGVEGRQYSGDAGFREGMFTISFNLPWINRSKYRAEIARVQAKLEAAQHTLADYELLVPAEARRIVTRANAARRQALLYREEILPRSALALQSAHAAWVTQRGAFLEVMEARRLWLEAQLMEARAVAEQWSMLAELTLCCGAADLEALQMLGQPLEPTSNSTP